MTTKLTAENLDEADIVKPGETYLYDGVYVSFDGFQFCLRAPREHGDHFVYLEPHAIKLFLEFVAQQEKHSREADTKNNRP